MKLASIERLHSVRSHTNADTLACGKILEWPVVFRKGDFTEGSLGVFIFPDVLVDETNPAFAFMERNDFKVWMARFRDEPSAGLLMPLGLLNDYLPKDQPLSPLEGAKYLNEGTDVGELIKCVKYEKPIPKNLDARGAFPTQFVSMTDEDNLLSNPRAFDELLAAGPLYITLKCDGSSCTFIANSNDFHVCSRKWDLKLEGHNEYLTVTRKYNLFALTEDAKLTLQYEVVGPGMNDNRMLLKELDLRLFNATKIGDRTPLGLNDLRLLSEWLSLPMVPVLLENYVPKSIDELKELANSVIYADGKPGEGIVIRPMNPIYSPTLGKSLSVKVININYKEPKKGKK